MRFDKEGKPHTLEEDILSVWKEHGLEVIEETVSPKTQVTVDSGKDITIWTIKARRIVGYTPKVPS